MHYLDEGQGDPILFVHGTPTWSFEFRHLVAGLAGTHRCIAPDHLGFGLSDRPAGAAYTPEAHAERLRGLRRRAGPRPLHAGGARLRRPDRAAAGARHPVARRAAVRAQQLDVELRGRSGDDQTRPHGLRVAGPVSLPAPQRLAAADNPERLRRPAQADPRHPRPVSVGLPGRRQPRAGVVGAGARAERVGGLLRQPLAAPRRPSPACPRRSSGGSRTRPSAPTSSRAGSRSCPRLRSSSYRAPATGLTKRSRRPWSPRCGGCSR